MTTVNRFDKGELRSPVRMDNGFVRVDAFLTKTGVFRYRNKDGSERSELRLPEEVFNPDSLKSFQLKPLTDDHPPEPLTADNTGRYSKGTTGETVVQDGEHVRSTMQVWDSEMVRKLDAGKTQLSCGYSCNLEFKEGTYKGQHYDAIQRDIRGNHVALVDYARAGPTARVHMDSADGEMIASTDTGEQNKMIKYRIDGMELEVSEAAAQALVKQDAARAKADADAATALASLKARADALAADLTKEQAARKDAEDPAKLRASITARVALETSARKHTDAKFDAMSDREIKVAVLAKLSPEIKTDGREDAYVQGLFDYVMAKAASTNTGLAAARVAAVGASGTKTDAETDPAEAARARMLAANKDAWKAKRS